MSELLQVIVAALVSALVAAAGTGFLVSRQLAALAATTVASFEAIKDRLEDHQRVHDTVEGRLALLEAHAMDVVTTTTRRAKK